MTTLLTMTTRVTYTVPPGILTGPSVPPPPFPANPLLVILMVVNGGQAAITEASTTQSETSLLNL